MPSVVHVAVTGNFAGVERYVCNTATELARRNWDVSVVGGDPVHMPTALGNQIRWLPGDKPSTALLSLTKLGRQDLCHVHMTTAELVAMAARPRHRAPIIATRHFAARRGSTAITRALAPLISASLAREVAVSDFVAKSLERPPDTVIISGVPPSPCLWQPSSRVALVLQRLEAEKDTLTALRAWHVSGLHEKGWSLRVVGDGAQRQLLESWARSQGVDGIVFAGWTGEVASEFARAGLLLAPAPADSLGLAVLEAMAAGVPVVACARGGHLETVGRLPDPSLFPPGDSDAAAAALRKLLPVERRSKVSDASRRLVANRFTVGRHVDSLIAEYEIARVERSAQNQKRNIYRRVTSAAPSDVPQDGALRELVVCSLEPWDDVWRRNQFFTDLLLRRNPALRVLFVEPAADPLFDILCGRRTKLARLKTISADGRLLAFRPLKVLPRRVGPIADLLLYEQVRLAARLMGFVRPLLWVNDVTYAPLIARTGWPSLYDVTDDWLLAPFPRRELDRLRHLDDLALRTADEVVVCSQPLLESRGAYRVVSLIPNAVDVEHFRRPRSRPEDMPDSPVSVYVGSLHDARLDVELVVELARTLPHVEFIFVGPNSLEHRAQSMLASLPNVSLLGPRPYEQVPAYLQHADVVIVPHRVSPFTESLDPIKAYECLAINTPTVATPVAGFRNQGEQVFTANREEFAQRVGEIISQPRRTLHSVAPPSWDERSLEFERVLRRASADPRVG